MCNENRNTIFEAEFSQISDANNWSTNASNVVQNTSNGRLRFTPDNDSTFFERILGNLDSNNNRLKVGFDFELVRPVGSNDAGMDVVFQFLIGSQIVGVGSACISEIESSKKAFFHLDRTFQYENLSGQLKVRIMVPTGHSNLLDLVDCKVEDFSFCEDNVRLYFVFDKFFENALNSASGVAKLVEYKIDGQETLTQEYFNETANKTIILPAEYLFADADIDGDNRVQDFSTPKSFNPFVNGMGLDFQNPTPYFGGKPTGTQSGSNYGAGILNIGLGKPQVLNGNLDAFNGAIFIDVDLSKDLKVVFDLLTNDTTKEVYNNPNYNRRFTIIWDAEKCEPKFFFTEFSEVGTIEVDQLHNGFLYGITDEESESDKIQCNSAVNYSGGQGLYQYVIDFGESTGEAGIDYDALGVPDKFSIEWNGQVVTSGYVGDQNSDQDLLNLGIPASDINTGNPSTAIGSLRFNKSTAQPNTAIITVDAPLENTNWRFSGVCPEENNVENQAEIGEGDCDTPVVQWNSIFVQNEIPSDGDVVYTDTGFTTPFDGQGNTFRMRVNSFPQPLIYNFIFEIDSNGVISGKRRCGTITPTPGGDLEISESNNGACETCWNIQVTVPNGETRQVQFESNFQNGGDYGDGTECFAVGLSVVSDGVINLSNSANLTVAIKGQAGFSPFGPSFIDVILLDGQTVIETIRLERDHTNSQCGQND